MIPAGHHFHGKKKTFYSFPGTASWSNGRLQDKAFCRFHLPGEVTEWGSPVQAVPEGLEFRLVPGGFHHAGPLD